MFYKNFRLLGLSFIGILIGFASFLTSCTQTGEFDLGEQLTQAENLELEDSSVVKSETIIKGVVQKGPFISGSEIIIQELDSNLASAGQVHRTTTTDDFGSFSFKGKLEEGKTKFIEIIATGYYFNEVTGQLSNGPLTLRSIVQVAEDSQVDLDVNVNILTTLAFDRTKVLVEAGNDFAEAKKQAQEEVLAVFEVSEVNKLLEIVGSTGISTSTVESNVEMNFEEMDLAPVANYEDEIYEVNKDHSQLLVISAVLQAGNSTAELSELISHLNLELKDTGVVYDKEDIIYNATELKNSNPLYGKFGITDVVRHLGERYKNLGYEDDKIAKEKEKQALMALYDATGGDNWKYNRGWSFDNEVTNDWSGVTVDSSGFVIELKMRENKLSGLIPKEIGDLKFLEKLDFYANFCLSGPIPEEIGKLTNLRYLNLYYNSFSGSIPEEIENLVNLEYLNLAYNSLSGSIPKGINKLTKLKELHLFNNKLDNSIGLSGEIPEELSELDNLTHIIIMQNNLEGLIPIKMAFLPNIEYFVYNNNNQNLDASKYLAAKKWLKNCISNCTYEDYLASQEENDARGATVLDSSTGSVRSGVQDSEDEFSIITETNNGAVKVNDQDCSNECTFPSGTNVTLEATAIQGFIFRSWDIYKYFSRRSKREVYEFKEKILENPASYIIQEDIKIVANFEEQSNYNTISLNVRVLDQNNSQIESDETDFEISLWILEDDDNWSENFPGEDNNLSIGIDTGKTFYIRVIGANDYIFKNWSGDLNDAEIKECAEDFPSVPGDFNKVCVSGEIGSDREIDFIFDNTPEYHKAIEKEALKALYNRTGGDSWTKNIGWDFDSEVSSDWYGVEVGSDGFVQSLKLDNNNLSGSLPKEIGSFNRLKLLDLESNNLSGQIPANIGNLVKLNTLYLNNNSLSGEIPANIGNLNQLSYLYLNNNNLSGSIGKNLAGLTKLNTLDLQNNFLYLTSGEIEFLYYYISYLDYNPQKSSDEYEKYLVYNTQREALMALYKSTDGDNWNNSLLMNYKVWSEDKPLSDWYGITLDEEGYVIKINLCGNGLKGEIPSEIGDLQNLKELHLTENNLTGTIPVEIGSLKKLEHLWVNFNNLSGEIPVEIAGLNNLKYFEYDFNGYYDLDANAFKQELLDTQYLVAKENQ